MAECRVRATGLELATTVTGPSSGPTVLFVHGAGQTRRSWRHAASALADRGLAAVTVDLRGHGDSDWPSDGDYSLLALADDVCEVARQLSPPVVLVGGSLGGLACLLATERVQPAGLALVDIVPGFHHEGGERVLSFMAAAREGFSSLEQARAAVAAYLPHRSGSLDALRHNLRVRSDGRWHWHWDPRLVEAAPSIRAEAHDNLLRAQAGLALPVLLVTGARSDVVRPEEAEAFLAAVPGAEHVALDRAGHTAATDDNDAFSSTLVDWVVRIAGS